MEDKNHNEYFDKPIEEVVDCLKLQKQRLIDLKQKQKDLLENDPDNVELKEQYEKEWSEVVGEIKKINEYNEHMKRINETSNETSNEKVDAKDNNMSFAGDISRRGDQPTIDEIKVLLTDNNSVSEDELQQHNKIQNDYRKYIQERYNDMMPHRPNMNPQMNGLIRNRNAKPLLDEFEDEIENNSGDNRNENILRDLNDIKELNKAIQRSNFSGDDIEMMKNRALPPTPITTGVSTPDTPIKYQYSNDSPARPLDTFDSDRHNDNYDTLSDRGYDTNPPDFMSYKRNTMGGYIDNQNDAVYYPSPGMNPMNVNPVAPGMSEEAALEWDQLKREVETEELIKLEKLENSSDIDIDLDMDVNMNMNMGMNRGMPMNMGMNRGMPMNMGMDRGMPMNMGMDRGMPMNMGMNMGMNRGMPMDMGMNRGMPMDMRMNMGMNRGMPMDMRMNMGMNRGMPMDMRMNMGMNRGMPMDMRMNLEMEMELNLDSVADILETNNNEYKGNKALKLLGVVGNPQGKNKYGGPTSPTKPGRPYISPNQPFPPNQKIGIVPSSEYIPMSGIGMGKNPVRIGDPRNDPRYMNDMALMNRRNRTSIERLNSPTKSFKPLGVNTDMVADNATEHTPELKNSLSSPLTNKQTLNINRNSGTFGGPVKRINEIRNSSQELVNDSMLSNNSNTSNGNNAKTKRYSKNRVTNSIDFSRPRDPKDMKPEEKLDAMLLPSLTTLRQVSINELVAKNAKNILVSGYLLKRSSSIFKKWKQRYFILCADNLYSFASENPKERALSCIPITKDAVVRTQVEDNKYIFVFIAVWYEFNIIQREFYLQTNTEEEMNLWVKQLKKAINVEKLKRTSLPKVPELPPTIVESSNSNKRYSKRNSNYDNNNSSVTANNNSVSNTAAKYGGSARTSEEITYRNNESFDSVEKSLNSSSIPSIVNEAFIQTSPSNPSSSSQSSSEHELVFPTRVSSADKESRLRHQILKNQQELEKLYNRNKERASIYSESYSRSSSKQDTSKQDTPTNRSHHSSRSSHSNPSNHSSSYNRSNRSHHSKHESTYSVDPNERILKNLDLDDLPDSDSDDDDNNYSEKNNTTPKNNYIPREENRMKTREGNAKNENINRARMRRQQQHQNQNQNQRSANNSFNKNEASNDGNISNHNNSTFNHNNSSVVNRSETIVIDGSSDENANLFVYQKILTSNKTNYRFDSESISMKASENEESKIKEETENEESKVKDYKNISSSSISISTTSPFTSSMSSSISSFSLSSLSSPTVSENDDSLNEDQMKKRLEIKKASRPTTHKIKKMNNSTKKINVLIDSLDKLKMSQEEDKHVINKNPMFINPDKSRSETTDSSMMTQTEEYFNKALSELAALSSLSKKI